MKTFALLVILSTLVSCGGSSGSNSGGPIKERFQDAFSSMVRGQTSDTTNKGQIRSYDYDTDTVSTAPSDNKDYEVILKIEGSLVYTYEVSTDNLSGDVDKQVTLQSYDASDIDELLKQPGTLMSGNFLLFSNKFENDWTLQNASVKETYTMQASLNLGKPLCEMTISMTSAGIMTTPAGMSVLPTLSTNSVQTCGRILSSDELRAIDLSSIDFCDQTSEDEINCESNRDMSFLTADL